jgi:CheY-like chemotaxis protein/anti-sigma regulatory factor (Ser/Thr protein kinase)
VPHILIAEDNDAQREGLRALLQHHGFEVTTAPDGAEAIEKLRANSFDLLLVDVWMPRMNGIEVLAQLKNEARKPRVIVMTADDTPETLLEAVREQAFQYIAKPYDPKALVQMVKIALDAAAHRPIEVVCALPNWVELLVPCELGAGERTRQFLQHLKMDLPDEVRDTISKAFGELLNNAIEWGGQLDPEKNVRICFLRFSRFLQYRITDPGTGFRWEEIDHAAVSNPPEHPLQHRRARQKKGLRPGGFGILMVQQMADDFLYNETGNEVVIVKYLEEKPAEKPAG